MEGDTIAVMCFRGCLASHVVHTTPTEVLLYGFHPLLRYMHPCFAFFSFLLFAVSLMHRHLIDRERERERVEKREPCIFVVKA